MCSWAHGNLWGAKKTQTKYIKSRWSPEWTWLLTWTQPCQGPMPQTLGDLVKPCLYRSGLEWQSFLVVQVDAFDQCVQKLATVTSCPWMFTALRLLPYRHLLSRLANSSLVSWTCWGSGLLWQMIQLLQSMYNPRDPSLSVRVSVLSPLLPAPSQIPWTKVCCTQQLRHKTT